MLKSKSMPAAEKFDFYYEKLMADIREINRILDEEKQDGKKVSEEA